MTKAERRAVVRREALEGWLQVVTILAPHLATSSVILSNETCDETHIADGFALGVLMACEHIKAVGGRS